MNNTITDERLLRKVHTVLGFCVIAMTLANLIVKAIAGEFSPINIVFVIPIMLIGSFIKHLNDSYSLAEIEKNQKLGFERLITNSAYGRVRNPSDLAHVLLVAGFMLLSPSFYSFVLFLIYFGAVNLTVQIEEKRLQAKFGEKYSIYRICVGRWTPWPLKTYITGKYDEYRKN